MGSQRLLKDFSVLLRSTAVYMVPIFSRPEVEDELQQPSDPTCHDQAPSSARGSNNSIMSL